MISKVKQQLNLLPARSKDRSQQIYEKYLSQAKKTAVIGREMGGKITARELEYVAIQDENVVAVLDPVLLINCQRFDVLAKYIYAKYWKLEVKSDWGRKLYSKHLHVLNGYFEEDGSGKRGEAAFVKAFNEVLDSVKESGFDINRSLVPVVNGKYVVDGGHRIVACCVYESDIHAVFCDAIDANNYRYIPPDYRYFRDRAFPKKFGDAMALEFCRLKQNSHTVILWPSAVGKEREVESILREYGNIFYQKDVFLYDRGPFNLIDQIDTVENWVCSSSDRLSQVRDRVNACFTKPGITRVYVFEAANLQNALEAKQKIGDLFGGEDRSVYISETHPQTVHLAELLLNDNSIQFLNSARLGQSKQFRRLLQQYKHKLEENNVEKDCFCIVGSSVLAAYGIQDSDDLEFVHHGYDEVCSDISDIRIKNYRVPVSGIAKDELLFNPQHYFYYEGVKIAELNTIKTTVDITQAGKKTTQLMNHGVRLLNLTHKVLFYTQIGFSYWGIYWVKTRGSVVLKRTKRWIGRKFERIDKIINKLRGL